MSAAGASRRGSRLGRATLVAAVIHVELLVLFGVLAYKMAPRQLPAADPIEITALDEEASREALEGLDEEPAPEKEEKPTTPEEKTEERPTGQVVELPRPAVERRPDKARFLAEHDSTVEKETRKLGKLEERAASEGLDQPVPSGGASRPARPAPPSRPGLLAMRGPAEQPTPERPGAESPDEQPPEEDERGEVPRAGHAEPQLRRPSRGSQPPSLSALMPSGEQIARAIGSGTSDHLPDIDDGEQTSLNARGWKFATFFNRVKRQIRENWKAVDEYRKRDPSGAIYGGGEHATILGVMLRPDGSLAGVRIEKPSGVEFLDDAAVEAVKRAQPFANPPRGLVDETGQVRFRFGFIFEIADAPRMRVYRFNSP
jgi:protein TonB